MPSVKPNPLLVGAHARGRGSTEKLQRVLWRWLRIAEEGTNMAVRKSDPDLTIMWLQAGANLADSYIKTVTDSHTDCRIPFSDEDIDDARD